MTTSNKVDIEIPKNNKSDSRAVKRRNQKIEKPKSTLIEEMTKGYQEMAEINLSICEEFFACESEIQYEN